MRIVLCNGIFDLLHVAHLRHLRQASKMGDMLVVGVTMDESAAKEKRRPIIPEAERLEMVRGLRWVEDAFLCANSLQALDDWKPHVFCKGHDYRLKGLLDEEIMFCTKYGIEIAYTDENPQTTSAIIERIRNG